jgi:hypothetical protein
MSEETPDQKRFLSYVKKDGDCWRWTGSIARTGYGNFFYKGTVWLSHRASLVIFDKVKSLTPGLHVGHACGNRDCVNPDHLKEKTASENNGQDKREHGKDCSGERCHFSKLNWEGVEAIRASDKKRRELASDYGVSMSCIANILRKKTWKTE